ncbi:MAG TPA: prepilin-type N-terminal cleavage/methylation domain-containing protein [Sumerlaeia bacterium]|nr:prepilin-type N-terminal cleavage/methylation domain-containing protein [Sumerlaeia bacterium]
MRTETRAFTLIELLIVVAIIAILAAIAVPNFLEAQTRSKVSRVMSDMRSIATAIESYTVDHGTYPIVWAEGVVAFGLWDWVPGHASNFGPYRQLTTPVAYMTGIPDDPFALFAAGNTYGSNMATHFGWYYHWEGKWHTDPNAHAPLEGQGYVWSLRSVGPSRTFYGVWETNIMRAATTDYIYDASNGTRSPGWIVMTNKGFYKGGPY